MLRHYRQISTISTHNKSKKNWVTLLTLSLLLHLVKSSAKPILIAEGLQQIEFTAKELIIKREFERVGIDNVEFNLIRAHQHGNPSKRLRVFISNLRIKPPRKNPPTVMETIGDLPSLDINEIFNPGQIFPNHEIYPLADDKMKSVRKTRWGQGAKHFRVSKRRSLPNWVRLFPDRLATSINGLSRYVHPYENRLLSVREHARLMSYPDSYVFIGSKDSQYNQVGESVPPLVSYLIAQEVRAHIE